MHRKQLIFNESTSQTELPTFTMFAFSDARTKEGGRERDEQRQNRPREKEKEMNKDKRNRERERERERER